MKKAIALLMTCVMSFSLAACGGGDSSTGSSDSTTSTDNQAGNTGSGDKIVIDVWTADRHDSEYVDAMIEEFNATNTSNIEIQVTAITDDYFTMLSMAYTSGTAPDIAGVSASSFGSAAEFIMYVEGGLFTPLNSYIEAAGDEFEKVTEISNHLFEGVNALGEDIYWIPTAIRSGTRVIYNETLTSEAGMTEFPATLSEMVTLSQQITANGGGDVYGFATTSSSPFVRLLQGVAELSGQNQYGYDFVNGVYDFSGFKEILEQFSGLLASDSLFPGSATQGVDAMRAQFADGKIGLWANASQEAGVFTDQFPVEDFEWQVAMPPTIDGEIKGALSATPQKGYFMMSSTDYPDEVWEVIEFFSSEEFIKGYCENGYALPYSDYMSSVVDTESAGKISEFALTEYESVYPSAPAITVDGDSSADVLWNAAMGYIDIDTAIEDLNTRYNAALERDIADGKVQRVIIADYDPMNPSAGTIEYRDN